MSARKLTALVAIATAASGGAATISTAADAPIVSEQASIAGKAPVTVPGTDVRKGKWMGSKTRLVFRTITLEGDQRTTVTLRAPKGTRIRGVAPQDGARLAFAVPARGDYAGDRSVQLDVRALGDARDAGEQTARVYAAVR